MSVDALQHFKEVNEACSSNPVLCKILADILSTQWDVNIEAKERLMGVYKNKDIQAFIGKVLVPTLKFLDYVDPGHIQDARKCMYFLSEFVGYRKEG